MSVSFDPQSQTSPDSQTPLNPQTGLNSQTPPPSPLSSASQTSPSDPADQLSSDASAIGPRRRHWLWIVGGLGIVGVVAVGGAIALTTGGGDSPNSAVREVRTVTAETRDLVEFTDLDGRMVYAQAAVITAAGDGVVTGIVTDGMTVARGDVVYEINALPIVAFVGEVPLYRPLSEGAIGDDVLMVEANLASLGHHTFDDDDGNVVDTGFIVDGVWDGATTDAVLRWQADVGRPETGIVEPHDLVVIDGEALAADLATDVGGRVQLGAPILTLNAIGSTESGYAEHGGDVELLSPSGTELQSGDVLYTVDEVPVPVIATDVDFTRDLADGVEPGDDVLVLEQMLDSLGFTADDDLDVDDEFDEATTAAILEWEEELADVFEDAELEPDGVVSPDEFVVVEPGTTVGLPVALGSRTIASGSELWTTDSMSAVRLVETSIAVADQDQLARGTAVDVEFPDGTIAEGVVASVATSSALDPTNPEAAATLAVDIELLTVPESVAGLNEVDVEVKLVDAIAEGVTTVPVSALVATGDGNYAVEAVTTTGTTFLPVEPGMFSDGFVEVAGVQPGTQVVVPS